MKNVLITGASTGIGETTAKYLAHVGYKVYAGVRKPEDYNKIDAEGNKNLVPVFLDVTSEKQIQELTNVLTELDYLINNAGVSANGPLELMDNNTIKSVVDVNLTGLLMVTSAFIPALRKTNGRIINISSGHGLAATPDKSVYAASKFGVQAASDSLRVELKPFGIDVSSIIVGKVDTKVLSKIMDQRNNLKASADPEVYELYKTLIEFFDKEVKDIPGIAPEMVAETIHKAMTDKNPDDKYLVGPGAKKMKVLGKLPAALRDKMFYKAIYK